MNRLKKAIKFTILVCGGSAGVPQIGRECTVCKSDYPKNQRLRSSLLITTPACKIILVDTGPDFRLQALRENIKRIDAVFILSLIHI